MELTYNYNEMLNALEKEMHKAGVVDIEAHSFFTPGLYTRSVIIPPNMYVLSHLHNTEHQFIMSTGEIIIYTENDGMIYIKAPYIGKTSSNTRRLAKTLTEVTWTSLHATNIHPNSESEDDIRIAIERVESELYTKFMLCQE